MMISFISFYSIFHSIHSRYHSPHSTPPYYHSEDSDLATFGVPSACLDQDSKFCICYLSKKGVTLLRPSSTKIGSQKTTYTLLHRGIGMLPFQKIYQSNNVRGNVVDDISIVLGQKLVTIAKIQLEQILVLTENLGKCFEPTIFSLNETEPSTFLAELV